MAGPGEPAAWHDRTLRTDRVAGWTHPCPDCKRPMPATGRLFRHRGPCLTHWYVEFHCARCNETCTIWTPQTEGRVGEIVRAESAEG